MATSFFFFGQSLALTNKTGSRDGDDDGGDNASGAGGREVAQIFAARTHD